MPVVNLPNGTRLNFPDGLSSEEMAAAIDSKFPEYASKPTEAPVKDNRSFFERIGDAMNSAQDAPTDYAVEPKKQSVLEGLQPGLPVGDNYDARSLTALSNLPRWQGAVDQAVAKGKQVLADKKAEAEAPLPERTTADYIKDMGLSVAEVAPSIAKIGTDVMNMVTLGQLGFDQASKLLEVSMSEAERKFGSAAAKAQRAKLQALKAGGASAVDLVTFFVNNPMLAATMATPSVGSVLAPLGAVKLATKVLGPLSAEAVTGISNATNIAMNAGDTFTQTDGNVLDKLNAATVAGVGTYVGGQLTGGGAEGALARNMSGAAPRVNPFAAVAKDALVKEPTQEFIENASQSIGQDFGERRPADIDKAIQEGTIGAILAPVAAGPMSAIGAHGEHLANKPAAAAEAAKVDALAKWKAFGDLTQTPAPGVAPRVEDMPTTPVAPTVTPKTNANQNTVDQILAAEGATPDAVPAGGVAADAVQPVGPAGPGTTDAPQVGGSDAGGPTAATPANGSTSTVSNPASAIPDTTTVAERLAKIEAELKASRERQEKEWADKLAKQKADAEAADAEKRSNGAAYQQTSATPTPQAGVVPTLQEGPATPLPAASYRQTSGTPTTPTNVATGPAPAASTPAVAWDADTKAALDTAPPTPLSQGMVNMAMERWKKNSDLTDAKVYPEKVLYGIINSSDVGPDLLAAARTELSRRRGTLTQPTVSTSASTSGTTSLGVGGPTQSSDQSGQGTQAAGDTVAQPGPSGPTASAPTAAVGSAPTAQSGRGLGLAPPTPVKRFVEVRNSIAASKPGVEVAISKQPLDEQQKVASAFANLTGSTFTLVEDEGTTGNMPNGFVDGYGGKHIYIDAKSTHAPLIVVAHEAVHGLPDHIRKPLIKALNKMATPGAKQEFLKRYGYTKLLASDKAEEIGAYLGQLSAQRPGFWQELRQKMGNKDFSALAAHILSKFKELAGLAKDKTDDTFLDRHFNEGEIAKMRSMVTDAYAQSMREQGLKADENLTGAPIFSQKKVNPLDKVAEKEGERAVSTISSKPGRDFTANGAPVKIVSYPKTKDVEFATSRLHARVRQIIGGSGFTKYVQSTLGLAGAKVAIGDIRGLWADEREDTFTLRISDSENNPIGFSQARKITNLLGFAFVQEGAVTAAPSTEAIDGIDPVPAVLIGKPNGAKMERGEVNGALAAARDAGFFGASEAMSGRGIKFLFFPDDSSAKSVDEQHDDFVAQVQAVQQKTGLTGWSAYKNVSSLDGAKDYWSNVNGNDTSAKTGSSGLQDGSGQSLDLFRGTVDTLLAPYIAALRVEGFGFDYKAWAAVNGATPGQQSYLESKVAELEDINKHGVVKKLRQTVSIVGKKGIGTDPKISQTTTNANAVKQLAALDEVLAASKDPTASVDAWLRMNALAYGTNDVPMAPARFIEMLNDNSIYTQLKALSPGQVKDADHGFANAAEFRKLYESGKVKPATTAKLMLWSFLSRGVSPYVQEGGFIDLVGKVEPFVQKMLDGQFTDSDAIAWNKVVSASIVKGTGQPGAGTTHNANAFGSSFMRNMAERMPDGRTKMAFMHDLFSDPTKTGREIRREFVKIGEGAGIDNKVISFTLLVIGHPDVAVLDRVQIDNTFNDGRLGKYNLYDGVTRYGVRDRETFKVEWFGTSAAAKEEAETRVAESGKKAEMVATVQPGSGMAGLTTGAQGLLIYEPLENALEKVLPDIFGRLAEEGLRSKDMAASVGRWHWESWVAHSGQEASHQTLDALLNEVRGDANPFADVPAKEGEYGAYNYGTEYAIGKDGKPYKTYSSSTGQGYKMDLDSYNKFIEAVKKAGKKGVVPSGFKVSTNQDGSDRSAPWFNDSRVNRERLDALVQQFGKPTGNAPAFSNKAQDLDQDITLEIPVEGGKVAKLTVNAQTYIKQLDARQSALEMVKECML
jgi:hypothetical protein